MRRVLLFCVWVAVAPGGCAGHRAASRPDAAVSPPESPPVARALAAPGTPAAVATTTPDVFRAEIAPLLARRCAPCHNPGGKMYERMPFDDAATVAAHPEGILKRIKDPAEHTLIEQWISSRSKP